ncbi:MAG: PAS domain-containing protein [Brachyspira sp.]|nr:PAS domain-containing protein [Brachyspira sp.]CCY24252.1 two-component sensor histidine kinase [Brachyspira sp. CAG:484]
MLWYIINFSIIIVFLCLFLITKQTNKRWSKINDYLGMVTNTVNSIRYGNLSTKIEKLEHPTYQNVTDSINRMVETLNDREKMIIEYQAELMRQNKLLESVINSLSDGILIVNEHLNILRATPQISTWFGVKGHDVIGKNITDFLQFAEENINLERLNNKDVFIKHTPTNNFIISSIRLSLDDNKKRYVLIIKDVTNEREIETLKEDFVATLTHDLKVPIVAEANILDFLIEGKFGEINDKQKVALMNMKISNKELIDLVQIVLETYKIKEKGIKLSKENIKLNGFISEIVNTTNAISSMSGIKVNFNPERDIKVTADPMQLERVIKNLINNAIAHSNTKKDIDIKTGEIPGFITISVIDYGQGVPPQEIKLIFNKYYSAAKKFRKIGTGLGLYLSQQVIRAHGGEITVDSEENVRTEFCIKIPS